MNKWELAVAKAIDTWERLPRWVHIYVYGGLSVVTLIAGDKLNLVDVNNVVIWGTHINPELVSGLILYTTNNVIKGFKEWLFLQLGAEVIMKKYVNMLMDRAEDDKPVK